MADAYKAHMSLKEYREAHALEQEREQEAAIAPIRKTYQDTVNKLAAIERDRVKAGLDEPYIDEDLKTATMSLEQAAAYNAEQLSTFLATVPEYLHTPNNRAAFLRYFTDRKDGYKLQLISTAMWEKAFEKLSQAGLLESAPKPTKADLETAAIETFKATHPEYYACADNLDLMIRCIEAFGDGITIESLERSYQHLLKEGLLHKPAQPKPNGEWGKDPITLEDRWYTNREVELMDSDTYRKCFKVARAFRDILHPVPTVMKRNSLN